MQSPNLVGSPLGILQLVLYCKYRKRGGVMEDPNNRDEEKSVTNADDGKLKQSDEMLVDDCVCSRTP